MTLIRTLGAGSHGTVYAARRDLDGWVCAIKVVRPHDGPTRELLRQEAALMSSLRLPHLVTLYELLELPDGSLALILDYVDGGNLTRVLRQRGRLGPGEVVTILAPVLATLAALHERGVVHGDVSTGNVLMYLDGRPALTDLGEARLVGQAHREVHGTEGFLAPELTAGSRPSAACDVYAAGALAWRMLTGEPAPLGVFRPPLAALVDGLPPALSGLIDECLAGEAAARPTAAEAARRALESVAARPVDVPVGIDPSDALTRRLPGATGDPRSGRVGVRGSRSALRVRGAGRASAGRDAAEGARGRPGRRAVVIAAAISAAMVLGLGGAWWRWGPAARAWLEARSTATPGSEPALSQPAAAPGRGLGATAVSGPRAEPPPSRVATAVESADPQEAIRAFDGLVQARAVAFEHPDPALVLTVHSAGSLAQQSDETSLRQLAQLGVRYEDIGFVVRRRSTPSQWGNRAAFTAQIETLPYTIVRPDGSRERRPGSIGPLTRFTLVKTASGWRIEDMIQA